MEEQFHILGGRNRHQSHGIRVRCRSPGQEKVDSPVRRVVPVL